MVMTDAPRRRRTVSLPPDLDALVAAAARRDGLTYSGWLAQLIHKELTLQKGLEAVAKFKRGQKRHAVEEEALARHWAAEAQRRSRRSGTRPRKSD